MEQTTKAFKLQETIHLKALRSLDIAQKTLSLTIGKPSGVIPSVASIDQVNKFYDLEGKSLTSRTAEEKYLDMMKIMDFESDYYKIKASGNMII